MPNNETKRTLTILQYLRENTDDSHPATIAQILNHLTDHGITTTRQTVSKDIASLTKMGIDIVCDRGIQNLYFIASRTFSVPELKIMIDAVQAANFISREQTEALVRKIAALASSDQASALKRNLYISSAKREESSVLNTVDWLNNAINENRKVMFQYLEYDSLGQKIPKHDGAWYVFSPYILVWDNAQQFPIIRGHSHHITLLVFGREDNPSAHTFHLQTFYRSLCSDPCVRYRKCPTLSNDDATFLACVIPLLASVSVAPPHSPHSDHSYPARRGRRGRGCFFSDYQF